jgi:hypothetical protein
MTTTAPLTLIHDDLAFDRKSTRRIDENGYLHVADCNLSKAQVRRYTGDELQRMTDEPLGLDGGKLYGMLCSPEELAKAAPSFNGMPLLEVHKPVSAEMLASDDDLKKSVVGAVGTDVRFVHPYLKGTIIVHDQSAIDGIEKDEKRELSSGYRMTPKMTPGTYEGEAYDGVMKDIGANHVALVTEGRAGSDVTVNDEKLQVVSKLRVVVDYKGIGKAVAAALRSILGDDNPEGINQYSGGSSVGASANAASGKAYSIAAKANNKDSHRQAAEAHASAAQLHNEAAKRFPEDSKERNHHEQSAKFHEQGAQLHQSLSSQGANDSVTEDDNPEGINQYSGAAHAASEHAAKLEKSGASKKEIATAHGAAANAHLNAARNSPQGSAQRAEHNKKSDEHYHAYEVAARQSSKPDPGAWPHTHDSCTEDIAERDDTNSKAGTEEYGDVKFADEKNHKYPIDTLAHVRAALSYWGQAKNRSMYSEEDQTTITRNIDSAARRFKIGNRAEGK